jgi:hypothetical protein
MRRPEVLISRSSAKLRPRMPFGENFETCHTIFSKLNGSEAVLNYPTGIVAQNRIFDSAHRRASAK